MVFNGIGGLGRRGGGGYRTGFWGGESFNGGEGRVIRWRGGWHCGGG